MKEFEKYKKLKELRDDTISKFEKTYGKSKETRYDKKQLCFQTSPSTHNLHNVMYFCNHYGLYGNSNVSSIFSDSFAVYVAKAATKNIEKTIYEAIELIELEMKGMKDAIREEKEAIEKALEEIEE